MSRFYRLVLLCGGAGGAMVLAQTRGGQAAWFLVWLIGGIAVSSLAAVMFSLIKVECGRRMESPVLAAGDVLQVELLIRHWSLLPLLWLSVSDRFIRESDGEAFTVTKLVFPGFKRRFRVRYRLWGLERGEYSFAGTELLLGDWWGLAVKRRRLAASGGFAVLPKARSMLPSSLPPGRGEEEPGRMASGVLASSAAYTVREYASGDPLHRIHWRSSARMGELMTRPMEPAEEPKFMICLNGTAAAFGRKPGRQLFEQGVEWAAGMLEAASGSRIEAGFACSSELEPWLIPGAKPDYTAILRLLAGLGPDGSGTFASLLRKAYEQVPPAYALMAVTLPPDEEEVRALCRLREGGRQVTLYGLLGNRAPTLRERDSQKMLELAGCRVYWLRECRMEGTVGLDAQYEGA